MADQKHERLRGNVPKQARSRQTLSRLLDAAEALLSEEGAEGATVPAIARRAGVSVGVIYRRFSDKDDLLRAVYERFFHRIEESNAAALKLPILNTLPPERLVRGVVTGMVVGYRHYRGILRALTLYAQNHPDAEFRRHAEQLSRSSVPHLVALILRHRRSIGHPDPDAAVPFALMTVAWILRGVLLEDESWHTALAPAGSRLEEELVRIVLRYLDVQDEAVASPFDAIPDAAPAPAPEEGAGRRPAGEGAHD